MKTLLFAEEVGEQILLGRLDGTKLTNTYEDLLGYKNPLVIAAREGQVTRVSKLMLGGSVVGWWELAENGYLDKQGNVKTAAFKKHDAVFYIDPARVYDKARDAYIRLINHLEGV